MGGRSAMSCYISQNETLWNVSTTGSRWLEPNVCRSNHLGPFLCFVGNELAEVGRRACHLNAALIDKLRLQLGISKAGVNLPIKRLDNIGRRVSR